jgi:MoxR-like ATPase
MTVLITPETLHTETGSTEESAGLAAKHIQKALMLLDRLLAQGISAAQNAYGLQPAQDSYRGLYISPEDVANLLKREPGAPLIEDDNAEAAIDFVSGPGMENNFVRLKNLFALHRFDLNLILLALAPELDVRYERLYAYLQDDVTRRRPSVDLALALLCPSLSARIRARDHFSGQAPLMRYQLVELADDPHQPQAPLIKKYIKLDERIMDYLIGSNTIDRRLCESVKCLTPVTELSSLALPQAQLIRLDHLIGQTHATESRAVFYFQGQYGVGKQKCAEALSRRIEKKLLVVDLEILLNSETIAFEKAVQLIEREATLQNAAVYWAGFDHLLDETKRLLLKVLLEMLEQGPGISFLSGTKEWEPAGTLKDVSYVRVCLEPPDYRRRLELWEISINGNRSADDQLDLAALANKFRLTGGQIKDAVATARNLARWRKPERAIPNMQDLQAACRLHSNRKLSILAQKVQPRFQWEDIVLPEGPLNQLKMICTHVTQRARVMDTWGFGRKLALGKGINALFAGPSGTGKTMAADIIANTLELELYKIDLSTVISKFIGETEKNLAHVFNEAETSNAVLFFDEADALFGKRSEVKDAHDRYANIEISYLLQRMEEYEGVSILATNLRQNMDEAFIRRLAFSIHFPMPEELSRLAIWKKIWPERTPKRSNLDFAFMARQFRLAGGNIKNIALAAAYLAAGDDGKVAMAHLIRATKEELLKMGKACVRSDFGQYYDLLVS